MTKEEKIKEAWGSLHEKYKSDININGVLITNIKNYTKEKILKVLPEFDSSKFGVDLFHSDLVVGVFPKSLRGIEDNNGWITLNNTPKEIPIELDNIELFNINTDEYYVSTDTHEFIEIGRFTHWKPLKKSNPPLF